MGFSFGKSKSSGMSGQQATQRHATNILFESLIPGSSMTGGYVSDKTPTGGTPAAKATPGTLDKHGQPIQGDGTQQLSREQRRIQQLAKPDDGTPQLFGGDPVEQTVSRQMGNYVPSARQQGFGALIGHGMTEAMRQQIGPYTDVQGQGRVASTNPLTQGQTDIVTKTLLPSLEDMRYKGMFERLEKETLPEGAAGIISEGARLASDPMGMARQQSDLIDQAVTGGTVPQLPELPAITEYINEAYTNMPGPLRNVIDDVLTGGTSANIEASIQKNVEAITAQAQTILTSQLNQTYGRFAASGVSGGAMLAAAGDVTTQVMANVSAQIADFYTQSLTQAQQQQQLALQTVDSLIGTAQQAQAMDSQRQAIDLETQIKLMEAKLGMYTTLSQEMLRLNQNYAALIAQEVDRENTEQVNSMRMFYEIMVSLATGGPALSTQRSKSTQFSVSTGGAGVSDAGKIVNPFSS